MIVTRGLGRPARGTIVAFGLGARSAAEVVECLLRGVLHSSRNWLTVSPSFHDLTAAESRLTVNTAASVTALDLAATLLNARLAPSIVAQLLVSSRLRAMLAPTVSYQERAGARLAPSTLRTVSATTVNDTINKNEVCNG